MKKFTVTQDDLHRANHLLDTMLVDRCGNCPVAVCVKREMETENVRVSAGAILIGQEQYHTPAEVGAFIRAYDASPSIHQNWPSLPLTFELPI